jgi:hypothetical protein
MKPSTTVFASSSSDVIRARTSGAKNLGIPDEAVEPCADDPAGFDLELSFFHHIVLAQP